MVITLKIWSQGVEIEAIQEEVSWLFSVNKNLFCIKYMCHYLF